MGWTPENIERVRTLAAAGFSASQDASGMSNQFALLVKESSKPRVNRCVYGGLLVLVSNMLSQRQIFLAEQIDGLTILHDLLRDETKLRFDDGIAPSG
jgi:hypothetical protein